MNFKLYNVYLKFNIKNEFEIDITCSKHIGTQNKNWDLQYKTYSKTATGD